MPLTMDILEYQLSFRRKVKKNRDFDKQELCMVRSWTAGEARKDVLYLIRPEQFVQHTLHREGLHFLFLSPPAAAEDCDIPYPAKTKDCDILYPAEQEEPVALFNDIQEIFWQYFQWMQKIGELFELTDPLTHVLEFSAEYMRIRLNLVGKDYTSLGVAGKGAEISSMVEKGQRMSFASVTSLEQEADYSHVLEFEHFFEYPTEDIGQRVLCFNIFLEGQYFARLLGKIPIDRPYDGAGQLLENLGNMLKQYYTKNLPSILKKEKREELEDTLKTLLSNKSVDLTATERTLAFYGWLPEHCYQVIRIEFLLDVPSLDYYRIQLEKLFPGSVALILEDVLYCVRNGILSPDLKSNNESFPAFLRDGLCKAGFSTLGANIFQLHYRRLEADIALRLGKKWQEMLWYFYFSDLILEFTAEVITEKLPVASLIHPAIRTLQDYDRQNNGELTVTLRQYLHSQGHSTQASEALCIHRTTFIHRMNRIQELTGLRPDNSKERLHLELSFYLLEQEKQA